MPKANDNEYDIFIANVIYPEAAAVFTALPKKLADVKEDCLIILDTNALFVPYAIGKESLEQIKKTYKSLVGKNRLLIPGQVAREFAKNRATKLVELFQRLTQKRNSIPELQMGRYPLLETLGEYQHAVQLEESINKQIQEYRKAIGKVLDRVQAWNWDDPVSILYNEIFTPNTVFDPIFDKDKIRTELELRYTHNVPPGYKDADKEDSGIGDFLIWKTILELGKAQQKSVILVSGDEKIDWRHKIGNQALYPRYELVDEFRRESGGHHFHLVQFSEFLNLYGASEQVVQEVRRKEQLALDLLSGSTEIPSALEQILEVCHEVLQNDFDYMDAVRTVAKRKDLWSTTIANKCTRRIGIDTATFRNLLENKDELIRHLIDWFPEHEAYIRKTLGQANTL